MTGGLGAPGVWRRVGALGALGVGRACRGLSGSGGVSGRVGFLGCRLGGLFFNHNWIAEIKSLIDSELILLVQ